MSSPANDNQVTKSEERELKLLGRLHDVQRGVIANVYLEPANSSGSRKGANVRHLIARYEMGGGTDLPIVDRCREFAVAIPDGWSESRAVQELFGPIEWATETKN